MIIEILLLANALIFLALSLEAKVRSKIGFAIVVSGLIIGFIDILVIVLSLLNVI
ncbi:MAG: hypothetical protein QXJ06_01540 [Candidatus Aenigmatarchaeota archaeon]|nr:hypothetical protein [Candidatus Aenigmarchaeota archaeon]MBU5689356.1 hypothetical protein [Candidatus Aenigmarchaeota archaeon]